MENMEDLDTEGTETSGLLGLNWEFVRFLIDITSLILSGPETSYLVCSQISNELKEGKFRL